MSCVKCACKKYQWNAGSAVQKFFSGTNTNFEVGVKSDKVVNVNANLKLSNPGMPYQDNKSDQVAYHNYKCGHHKNFHYKK